jgi:hypothetical protein
LLEDIKARWFRDGAEAVKHHQVPIEWDFEVGICLSAGPQYKGKGSLPRVRR